MEKRAQGTGLLLLFAAMLLQCGSIYASTCEYSEYSSYACIKEGDFGDIDPMRLCTFCNIYISPQGKFIFLAQPDEPAPKTATIVSHWKPATGFAFYELSIKVVTDDIDTSEEESINTTMYIVPRLEV